MGTSKSPWELGSCELLADLSARSDPPISQAFPAGLPWTLRSALGATLQNSFVEILQALGSFAFPPLVPLEPLIPVASFLNDFFFFFTIPRFS